MRLSLARREVHVWHVDVLRSSPFKLRRLLSTAELKRAVRFRFPQRRDQFIVARGLLRTLLGGYVGVDPQCLAFSYGQFGKPSLAEPFDTESIRFNVSHSDGIVLYAFARDAEIGVDVERVRTDVVRSDLAEHYFAAGEVSALRALPETVQPEAFFACWTRKEAYLKARGLGLTAPLDRFEVSLVPGDAPRLQRCQWDPAEPTRWSFFHCVPAPGCLAAVAVEGNRWDIKKFEWNERRERVAARGIPPASAIGTAV